MRAPRGQAPAPASPAPRCARAAASAPAPAPSQAATASPRPRATSQAQWSATPDAAARVGVHGHRERKAPVQPLAVAAQRDERLEATGRRPARPRAACAAGRRASPTRPAPSRASGSTSCRRAPRQLEPVAPRARRRLRAASRSDDLRLYAGSLRRASLSFPHRSKLAALTRSTGSERPGPRGDRLSLRSRRLIRLTDSARSLNSV